MIQHFFHQKKLLEPSLPSLLSLKRYVPLPKSIYECVFRSVLRFPSAYLDYVNKGNYSNNEMKCVTRIPKKDVIIRLTNEGKQVLRKFLVNILNIFVVL